MTDTTAPPREPTEAMILTGRAAVWAGADTSVGSTSATVEVVWRAMWDAWAQSAPAAEDALVARLRENAAEWRANDYEDTASVVDEAAARIAELTAEVEAMKRTHIAGGLATVIAERNEWKVAATKAALAERDKDAERYRLLRTLGRGRTLFVIRADPALGDEMLFHDALDDAIDAAIRESKP